MPPLRITKKNEKENHKPTYTPNYLCCSNDLVIN